MRWIGAVLFAAALALGPSGAIAQGLGTGDEIETAEPRAATGGAQTLEEIMRRQAAGDVTPDNLGDLGLSDMPPDVSGADGAGPLGTLGAASDPDLWRQLRANQAEITTQVRNPGADMIMQFSGMEWLQFREGPLRVYGGYFLLGVLALLAIFFLIRGRIRIDAGRSGITIERFKFIERFGHWLIAGSFIILGLTGLFSLFGRKTIALLQDPENPGSYETAREIYASMALWAKWIHDNVAWAFMLGLVMVFVMWVLHNIPNRHDLVWLAKGGGIFSKSHPPAKKFNAGQKIIFWAVIVLGASISASGLSLLFPFELPMFAKTFGILNDTGLPEMVGYGPLPETLTPHAEMQYAQLWHAIVAFVFIGIIFAHIYLGTIGMEGAYDAMGNGEVDLNWAKEHHGLWVDEVQAREGADAKATPAE